MTEYQLGVIIGSIIMGAIVGSIPAVTGIVKKKIGLAIGGFFACIVGNFLLGLFLSVPICIVFMFFILKKPLTAQV